MKKNGRIKNFHEKDLDKPSASIVISGELFKLYFDEDVDLNMIKSTLEKKITKISEEMKKIDVRLFMKIGVQRRKIFGRYGLLPKRRGGVSLASYFSRAGS